MPSAPSNAAPAEKSQIKTTNMWVQRRLQTENAGRCKDWCVPVAERSQIGDEILAPPPPQSRWPPRDGTGPVNQLSPLGLLVSLTEDKPLGGAHTIQTTRESQVTSSVNRGRSKMAVLKNNGTNELGTRGAPPKTSLQQGQKRARSAADDWARTAVIQK